jgi:hypothetical protein
MQPHCSSLAKRYLTLAVDGLKTLDAILDRLTRKCACSYLYLFLAARDYGARRGRCPGKTGWPAQQAKDAAV